METALQGPDPAGEILERAARLSLAEMAELRRWREIEISIGARPPASSPLLDAEGLVRKVLGRDRTREVRGRVLAGLGAAVGRQLTGVRRWWAVRATAPVVEDVVLAVLAEGQLPPDRLEQLSRPWRAATAAGALDPALGARDRFGRTDRRWSLWLVASALIIPIALLFGLPAFPDRAVREVILYGVGAGWLGVGVALLLWRTRQLRRLGLHAWAEIAGLVVVVGIVIVIVALSVGR